LAGNETQGPTSLLPPGAPRKVTGAAPDRLSCPTDDEVQQARERTCAVSVPFLRRQSRPVTEEEVKAVAQSIADLDSDTFAVRKKARRQREVRGMMEVSRAGVGARQTRLRKRGNDLPLLR